MPTIPLSRCGFPGCAGRAPFRKRYCATHELATRKANDATRRARDNEHYDYTWRRLRDAYLRQHPLCECDDCKRDGRITPAQVVDHIVPVNAAPERRLDWSNLRAMSKRCHDRHTAREQGFGRSCVPPHRATRSGAAKAR
jgi:5-methylcytosine-specific restriction protein A